MTKQEAAQILARWWALQINTSDWDNGDRTSQGGLFAEIMARELQERGRQDMTPAKLEIFTRTLAENLEIQAGKWLIVSVYYHPSENLANALAAADIAPTVCPAKTASRLEQGDDGEWYVWVSAGYQAPWVKITTLDT